MIDRDEIAAVIAGFSTAPAAYRQLADDELGANGITLDGAHDTVSVFVRDGLRDARIVLASPGAGHSSLFIGDNLAGQLRIALRGDGSTVFIGDNVSCNDLDLRSRQDGDLIAIGNDVAVTGPGLWVSGLEAWPGQPALVVGDCCLLAGGVTLRNSDGHPVLRRADNAVANAPRRGLLIEPHAWLGERSAVLKDVTIGAFARVGFGSVVTRDVPRYAVAQGVPARWERCEERYWAWDDTPAGRERAEAFLARFPPVN